MKNGKRPTRSQQSIIEKVNLQPRNWLVFKDLTNELHLVHRYTGTVRVIPK